MQNSPRWSDWVWFVRLGGYLNTTEYLQKWLWIHHGTCDINFVRQVATTLYQQCGCQLTNMQTYQTYHLNAGSTQESIYI